MTRTMFLGGLRPIDGRAALARCALPPQHLTTHGVIVGMTGSGKTGLVMVLVEEALRSRVPVLMIDVKGDLGNLAYAFPSFAPEAFVPHLDAAAVAREGDSVAQRAGALASARAGSRSGACPKRTPARSATASRCGSSRRAPPGAARCSACSPRSTRRRRCGARTSTPRARRWAQLSASNTLRPNFRLNAFARGGPVGAILGTADATLWPT